jgi:hypothetical protein
MLTKVQVKHMRKTGLLAALGLVMAAALTACGGGGDAFATPGTTTPTPANTPTTISATASSPTLQSDGSVPVEIQAFVRNAANQFVAGTVVNFAASSGGLTVTQGTTDASGLAKATLIPVTPDSRTITVTVTAGTLSSTVKVDVAGSSLSVQGPISLNLNQVGNYTVTLLDAHGTAIAGKAVTISSARSNTLTPASVTTDANGRGTFTLTAVQNANDTITATSLGVTATLNVAVNADGLAFTAPAASPVPEVALGATQTVTVHRTVGGVAAAGVAVSFSTTRGTVTPSSTTTNASGDATATISATNAGGAVITATAGASSASLNVEFVATTPATITVQPDVFAVGPGQTATLTAIVRDPANNLVKNQAVDFTLTDTTGGTLSVGTAVTDSQGRAQTVYTGGATSSASNGVRVTATVHGTAITAFVDLTVSRREVFISLGTGNTISEPDTATYLMQFTVSVTDANGLGIANVPLTMKILSTHYYKGFRTLAVAPATGWTTTYTVTGPPVWCADEDVNHNGTLDPGEDFNGNGIIDAGNIAVVSAVAPATSVVTGSDGRVLVNVTYPQQYAYYLDVALSASTAVSGTEYVHTSNFMLPGSSTDFSNAQVAPPGPVSPFGTATVCTNPN